MPAAISVGVNPTFAGERSRRVEAYVLDPTSDLDLYDREVEVVFVERLRGMLRFESVEDLVAAMQRRRRPGARGAPGLLTARPPPTRNDVPVRPERPSARPGDPVAATEQWFLRQRPALLRAGAARRRPSGAAAAPDACPLLVGTVLAAVGVAALVALGGVRGPHGRARRR